MTRRIAVTGGAGLIGAEVINAALARGDAVVALARHPQKFVVWGDRISLVTGDLSNAAALEKLLSGCNTVIHCAGLTHARADADYHAVNVEGAGAVARAAYAAGVAMAHASSLSARLANASPYARSKRDSEDAVRAAHPGAVVLRLPAIYGPRDMATLPYFKMVKAGLAAEPATRPPARATLLYVDDAAAALTAAATPGAPAPGVYDVDDDAPAGRSWTEIGQILGRVLGVRTRRATTPRWALALWQSAVRLADAARGAAPTFRTGQINEIFHPDWVARDNLLSAAGIWRAKTPLEEGFAKTARWYQKAGLL